MPRQTRTTSPRQTRKRLPSKCIRIKYPRALKSEKVAEDKDSTCVICLVHTVNTVTIPCGHESMCVMCSRKMTGNNAKCPLCRASFDGIYRIYPGGTSRNSNNNTNRNEIDKKKDAQTNASLKTKRIQKRKPNKRKRAVSTTRKTCKKFKERKQPRDK